jgi:uncharacterized protein YkwD
MAKAKKKSAPVKQAAIILILIIAGVLAAGQIALHKPGGVTITEVKPEAPMLDQVNEVRAKTGKKAVVHDPKLDEAAREKVDDQVNRNYWSHHLPGERIGQFVSPLYSSTTWKLGENIAKCQMSDTERIKDWANSPEHYATMVGDYDAMGYAERANPQDKNCVYTVMYFIKY